MTRKQYLNNKSKLVDNFSLVISNKISGDYRNISIDSFDIVIQSKILFKESKLTVSFGKKYGVIGKNGIGKSTLLKHIFRKELPIHPDLDCLYVEQEVEASENTPVYMILQSNEKRHNMEKLLKILRVEAQSETQSDNFDMEEYVNLERDWRNNGFDQSEGKVRKILKGLGFSSIEQDQPIEIFSGGWRMRISIAQALFIEPTLLMLDEPTNHLDLNTVIWLTDYLSKYKKSIMVISHNKNFLNEICTDIIHIDAQKCNQYHGNYDMFCKMYEKILVKHNKDWNKLEKRSNEMSKKGSSKKEIKSFMDKSNITRPPKEYIVNIEFFNSDYTSETIIDMKNILFSYDNNVIFRDMNFSVNMNSKIAIVGQNGVGKSTLLQLMMQSIKPNIGMIECNTRYRIGYYSQHFASTLPSDLSAVDYLLDILNQVKNNDHTFTDLSVNHEQYIRKLLGQIGLEGSHHKKLICSLSGGQKARVAFVSICLRRPHILLLDEPSNNLDIETLDALINAINSFNGGIVIITHDVELIQKTNLLLYSIEQQNVKKFAGNYDKYKNYILSNIDENDE
jgi:ATP-binding cassette, subfamily F, member 1